MPEVDFFLCWYTHTYIPFFNNDVAVYLSQYQITKTITTFVFHNIVKLLIIHLRLWAFISQTRNGSFKLQFVRF